MTSPVWEWDETIQRGTDYASPAEVRAYDERMGAVRDVAREIDCILAFLSLSPEDVVLEIGTGTGSFARAASRRCREVIALDISAAMLQYAARCASEEGLTNVSLRQAGFLSYRHEGEPVAAVVSQLALHHLPDVWKFVALKRINQIIRPTGKLFLTDVVYRDDMEQAPSEFMENLVYSWPESLRPAMARHVAHEFSTFDWTMRELLKRAGFTLLGVDFEDCCLAHYLCSKAS